MTHRTQRRAAIGAALLLLAGCTGDYRGVESQHQPVVSRTDYVFDVQSSGYGIAPGEAARLAGWMAALHVGYGDTVALDDPSGNSGIRSEVAAQAASRGLLLNDTAPVTAAPVAPGTVRVIVSRAAADVPGCPNYRQDVTGYINWDQHTSGNYGCSVNTTLARMVADPVDLVRGKDAGLIDTRSSSKAVQAFRNALPSGGGGTRVSAESTGGR